MVGDIPAASLREPSRRGSSSPGPLPGVGRVVAPPNGGRSANWSPLDRVAGAEPRYGGAPELSESVIRAKEQALLDLIRGEKGQGRKVWVYVQYTDKHDVQSRLEALRTSTRPFAEKPDLHSPTTWVEPELVAEVKFTEWTSAGAVRAPVYLGLRDDRDPRDVVREDVTRGS